MWHILHFDTVPTKRRLAKFQSYGIGGNILKWVINFLTQRHQIVIINGKSSGWCDALSGHPQGCVLCLLLFQIFINKMYYKITVMIHLFADDTKINLRFTLRRSTTTSTFTLWDQGRVGWTSTKVHLKKIWVLLCRTASMLPNT